MNLEWQRTNLLLGLLLEASVDTFAMDDGRALSKHDLILEVTHADPNIAMCYMMLAQTTAADGGSVTLLDGRTLDACGLLVEAIRCDPTRPMIYLSLGRLLTTDNDTVMLTDGRVMSRLTLALEARMAAVTDGIKQTDLDSFEECGRVVPASHPWSRRYTRAFGRPTGLLFATLLLGLQRLEETGRLPLAHQAMLEDMLEGWTWGDSTRITL